MRQSAAVGRQLNIESTTRRHSRKIAVLATVTVIAGSWGATAAAQAVDSHPPAETLVLRAAHLFDATSEELLHDAAIVVRDGRIAAAGHDLPAPAGARFIDFGEATLLPGFIDAHSHLTLEPDANYYRKRFNELMRPPAEQALYAAVNARRTLEAGFTTVRHVGGRDFIDIGLRNAIDAGITAGPHMLVSANPITATGGSCDQPPFPPARIAPKTPMEGVCNGADQCREAVRYQMKWGADVIKVCASGGVLSYDPVDVPQLTPAELDAIISEAHAWGLKVAAHAHGDTAARYAIEAGVDSIEHGSFVTEDTLELMERKDVYLVPTLVALAWVEKNADTYPPLIAEKARVAVAAHDDMFRAALRIGVPVALGTDITVMGDGHGKNAIAFGLMVEHGMTPAAALLAGTREAAKLLGREAHIGTLEPGKWADIVAVPGNVLEDIHATEHPLFVMQRGRIIVHDAGAADGR